MITASRIASTRSLRSRPLRFLRMACIFFISVLELPAVAQAQQTYTVITSQIPATTGTDGPYQLGMKFTTTQAGQINAIRFYKVSGESGTHAGQIWPAGGGSTPLASVTFSGETSSGWQQQSLSVPLAIQANTTYVVTVNSNTAYGATNNQFTNAVTDGPISSVADGANGLYGPAGAFPTSSFANTDYFRDVIFQPVGANQVAAPSFSPAGGTYSLPLTVAITSTTGGASIRYTTDGSAPTEAVGTPYGGPISVASSSTLRAIAYESGMTDSAVTSSTYSAPGQVTIAIDQNSVTGKVDWTPYSLGQGGLWSGPMIAPYISPLQELHPKFVRVFLQEYYNEYPAPLGTYNWTQMDQFLSEVVATGAVPIANIDFKPATLYPTINQNVVDPTSYADWDALIQQLVQHTKDMGFGIQYWEIGNEPDSGEAGGTPYLFTPSNYVNYYSQTANAIRSTDPTAKVGGPALASLQSPIGAALMTAAGNGQVPLDFFSWHSYGNVPGSSAASVQASLTKLGLSHTQTFLSEWNMSLGSPNTSAAFQPAFVLESTRLFFEGGLSMSAYYQIHDNRVYTGEFLKFMSASGAKNMANYWDENPQYLGLFDFNGNMRPAFHVLRLMNAIQGSRLAVSGLNSDTRTYAVQKSGGYLAALLWNFSSQNSYTLTLNLPNTTSGYFKLAVLNTDPSVNDVQVVQHGLVANLATTSAALGPYQIYWLETNPIDLSSDSLQFSAIAGANNPAQQSVTITYNGANPGVAFSATADVPWITLSTLSGAGAGQVIGTSVDLTGLTAGLYMGTVSVSRGDLPTTTYRVTLNVAPVDNNNTIFTSQTPNFPDNTDNVPYELGTKFQTSQSGHITAIRYYKAEDEPVGGHTGRIWDSSGRPLGSVVFTNETSYGWQQATLATPVPVAANTTYTVSVNVNSFYVSTPSGLATPPNPNGPLQALTGGGVLNATPGAFPTTSFQNSNYFRDVVLGP
jgi:xylan 1,4-beta-xylosidase